jgi:hypothetical protein
MPFLSTETLGFSDSEPLNADLVQCFFNFIEFKGFDNCLNFSHQSASCRRFFSTAHAARFRRSRQLKQCRTPIKILAAISFHLSGAFISKLSAKIIKRLAKTNIHLFYLPFLRFKNSNETDPLVGRFTVRLFFKHFRQTND